MENSFFYLKGIVLISVIAFIAYSNSFNSEFHFDDYSSIIAHPHVKSTDNIPYFFYSNGSPLVSRPVTMTTFAVNYKIGGLKPFSYHIVNFILHVLNAILVYFLVLLTFKTPYFCQSAYRKPYSPIHLFTHSPIHPITYSPLFIALIFAVHPIQTQAVTYIVQRAEILSAFFYLLAIVLFVKARLVNRDQRPQTADQRLKIEGIREAHCLKSSVFSLLSVVSAILAMGSKEIAVTLPVVILLYDFFFISDGSINALSKRWKVHLLFFLTLIPLMYFMGISQLNTFVSAEAVKSPPTSSIYSEDPLVSRYEYLLTQFRVVWTYISLLILPINQNVDYNYPVSKGLLSPLATLFGGVGIIALFLVAIFLFRRQRVISFFICWFFIVLIPTSSVAALPDVIFEHRAYLASLGYFVIFAMGVFRVSEIIFKRTKEL